MSRKRYKPEEIVTKLGRSRSWCRRATACPMRSVRSE